MEDKGRSELLQRTEQIKAASSLAGNAGLALVAAALGRWFFEGLDENAVLWLLCGSVLVTASVRALTMLDAEI